MKPSLRALSVALSTFALGAPVAASSAPPITYLQRTGPYWQAWVMNPDGSGARAVTTSPREKTRVAWFPDGRSLLVSTEQGDVLRVDVASGSEEKLPVPRNRCE